MTNYEKKYLKYKLKYEFLKDQIAGDISINTQREHEIYNAIKKRILDPLYDISSLATSNKNEFLSLIDKIKTDLNIKHVIPPLPPGHKYKITDFTGAIFETPVVSTIVPHINNLISKLDTLKNYVQTLTPPVILGSTFPNLVIRSTLINPHILSTPYLKITRSNSPLVIRSRSVSPVRPVLIQSSPRVVTRSTIIPFNL